MGNGSIERRVVISATVAMAATILGSGALIFEAYQSGARSDGEQNLADELQGLEVTVPGMHRTVQRPDLRGRQRTGRAELVWSRRRAGAPVRRRRAPHRPQR